MSTIDPHGNIPENQFTEVLELQGNNSNRIYILDHAPFYSGAVLQLKGTPNPLREGIDYNLVYRVEELKGSVARDLYNGIELLIDTTGSLVIVGQVYDRSFKKPLTDLATEMLRYLNEPIKTSYNNIEELPSIFPPKPTYRPWYNIGNKQYIASSVDDVEVSVGESSNDLTVIVEELKQRTIRLRESMAAVNVPGHVANKNPHIVTLAQLKAHPVNMAAADTTLAYGHDVLELVRLIRESGLSDADIDRHISNHGASDIEGVFSFVDGKAKIKTEDGKSALSLNNGSFILETDGVVVLRAGYTKLANKYLELVTGINTLRFESSGVGLDDSKITLNGVEFITVSSVFDFNPEPGDGSDETIELVYTSDGLVVPSGRGSPTIPLSANFNPPPGSETVEGKVLHGDLAKASSASNTTIPANSVVRNDNLLVPKTWKINNKPLSSNINIYKADIGLDRVDNTADLDKPVSDPLRTAIDGLSEVGHKHTTSGLSIDLATDEMSGKSRVADNFEEVKTLNDIIASFPEEGDPTSDLNNNLFGITDRFFDELKKYFFDNAPDAHDVFDLRKLTLSATSSVDIVADGSVLTVQPGARFLAPNSKAGGPPMVFGEISGSTELRNVVNRQWHSGASTFDSKFGKCNVISASEGRGAVIEPGNPPQSYAGIKIRFDTDEEILTVYYTTNVSIEYYFDGVWGSMGTGGDWEFDIVAAKGAHVLSFVFNAHTIIRFNAKIVATDMMGRTRVVFETNEKTIFGYYGLEQELNTRHFLYANTSNGKIYTLNGLNAIDGVSTNHVYLGHVDVDRGKVIGGPNVHFAGRINYGPVAEVNEHSSMGGAHTIVDTVIPGLEKMKPFGVMTTEAINDAVPSFMWSDPGSWVIDNIYRRDVAATFSLSSMVGAGMSRRMNMFVAWKTVDKSPAQFRSYKNTLLNNRLGVYEGCFQHYTHTRASLKYRLVFIKNRTDGKHDVLTVDLDQEDHVIFTVAGLSEYAVEQRPRENMRVITATSTRNETSCSSVSGGTYKSGNLNIDPVGHFTYRYDVNNKTFYTTCIKPGIMKDGVLGRVAITRTIKFNEDVGRFFKSDYAGMFIEPTPSEIGEDVVLYGISATPFPIPPELGDYRRYIDYDELFKTYLTAETVQSFINRNNGMSVCEFEADPFTFNWMRPGYTGFFGNTELGTVISTCEYTFPICIMPSMVPTDVSYIEHPAAIYLKNPSFRSMNIIKGTSPHRYGYGMGVVTTNGRDEGWSSKELPRQISLSIDVVGLWSLADASNTAFTLNIMANAGAWIGIYNDPALPMFHQVADARSIKTYNFTKPKSAGVESPRIVVEFSTTYAADLIFKIEGSFIGGQTKKFTFEQLKPYITSMHVTPKASGVVYYTPWHITQKTWDWYNTIAKNKL